MNNSMNNAQGNKAQRSFVTQQAFLIKLAIVFLTRLPITITDTVQDKDINAASGYFPLVGLIIASLVSAVLFVSSLALPIHIAVIVSMIASLLITGAFHEDGLADTADGFGGGWTAQKKLNIMKDSRLGTYGTCALIMALLLKYQTLVVLAEHSILLVSVALIFAHMFSRILALSVIPASVYAEIVDTDNAKKNQSKTKPVAQLLTDHSMLLLRIFSLIAVALLTVFTKISLVNTFIFVAVLWGIRCLLIKFYHKQIAGYNGDVLGATQQIIEISCYLGIIILYGSSSIPNIGS